MTIVKEKAEAKKLCVLGLQFRGALKMVEKYQDARPGLVYITCYIIKYQ